MNGCQKGDTREKVLPLSGPGGNHRRPCQGSGGERQIGSILFNYQPWRFVFVYDPGVLREIHAALSKNNEWAHDASMIIAVFSKPELDCIVRGKEYHLFDTGMASALLMLRATELGLVAHPIAGFREKKVKTVLGIPDDMRVITLIMVARHSETLRPTLTDKQKQVEKERPERLPLEAFVYINKYS